MTDEPEESLNSSEFWDGHYAAGGNSGTGSYGRLAEFKAEVLNEIIAEMHADGTLTTLSNKWYGTDLTTKVEV